MSSNNIWSEIFNRSGISFLPEGDNLVKYFAHNTFVNIYSKTSSKKDTVNKKLLICLPPVLLGNNNSFFIDFFEFIESLAFYFNISIDQMILSCKTVASCNTGEISTDSLLGSSDKFFLCDQVNLLDYINKNNLVVINFSADLEFIEDKFSNRDYAYIRTLDLSSVLCNPLLKKQVFQDVVRL